MKRIKFLNINNRRIILSLSFALLLLVTTTLTGTLSVQIINPVMAKKDNKLITTDDIADNAVTSPKIKDGEVKTSDIEDGTINGDDVSPAFMIRKTLKDDDAGHAVGWNPGDTSTFNIRDPDAAVSSMTSDSVFISVMSRNNGAVGACWVSNTVSNTVEDFFSVYCSASPDDGSELHYIITKLPPHVVSSPSSSTESSPFSSLGQN
jgi:hypothetical protein